MHCLLIKCNAGALNVSAHDITPEVADIADTMFHAIRECSKGMAIVNAVYSAFYGNTVSTVSALLKALGKAIAMILAYVFFAITFAYYLIAKLSLAMVILIGPLFIGAMLFPSTRQWGMNWIGQVLNYSIIVVFFVILGALQNDFF